MSPVPWKALKQVDPTAAVIVSQPPNDTTIAKKFRVQLPPGLVGYPSSLHYALLITTRFHTISISDIEATGLALGIISTIISIIKATTKVYEAVKNEADLPKNFKKSATKLPLISKFLQDTERYIEAADEATKTAFTPTLKNYKAQAIQLRGLFEKVIPEEGK
ncbi:hypothetical protein ACMFMF_009383 [Clarireedia jacksonii]